MAKEASDNFEQQTFADEKRHLQWRSVAASELGFVRSVNEDAHLDAREKNLWVGRRWHGGAQLW